MTDDKIRAALKIVQLGETVWPNITEDLAKDLLEARELLRAAVPDSTINTLDWWARVVTLLDGGTDAKD